MKKIKWKEKYDRWFQEIQEHCRTHYGAQNRLAAFVGVPRREASRWIRAKRNIPEWAVMACGIWLEDEKGPMLPGTETEAARN